MHKLSALAVVSILCCLAEGCSKKESDPCGTFACLNGGTCLATASGDVGCACLAGFSGTDCGVDDSICDTTPCDNGGTCAPAPHGYTCTCPAGISGSRCQILPASCAPDPCQNGAPCSVVSGAVKCDCPAGFSGPTCATVTMLDSCTPDPCKNGGTCALMSGMAKCTCAAGYSGTTCETNIDDCAGSPCKHGGTCTDKVNAFSCACAGDYIGDTCETFLPPGDLDLSVANTQGRTCLDGGDMVSYSVSVLTPTTATVSPSPAAGCLAVGDEVLLINLQGTGTHIFNVGVWETHKIASIAGAVVTFTVAKTHFFGDDVGTDANLGTLTTNQRVVLQRIPAYQSLAIDPARQLTAAAWNGVKGGIFAMRVVEDLDANGVITMAGKGYRGGVTTAANTNGQEGESLRGLGINNVAANTGGGGGGSFSPGFSGGGGGYGGEGAAGDTATSGSGGVSYGDSNLDRIFLGSGGGAGGSALSLGSSPAGGFGGAGGGIIMIFTGGKVTGTLLSTGTAGYGDAAECTLFPSTSTTDCWDDSGPGGGGAGGSILVQSMAFSGVANVAGGGGADGVNNANGYGAGNGGTGGPGRSKTN